MKNVSDFSSRISARAVTGGVMAAITCLFLLLSLIAALGIWDFNLNTLAMQGAGFWFAATFAWAICLFFGGFVSSLGSRPQSLLEGVLNGVVACCATYLFTAMILLFFASSAMNVVLSSATPQFYQRVFIGDCLAFAFGIYGGIAGAHFEQRALRIFKGEKKVYV